MSEKKANRSERVVLIVLDSVGVGELPDAADYGDVGSHTLGHIAEEVAGFDLPRLREMGLGNIEGLPQMEAVEKPTANYGRMMERAHGKDTATGHWELVGVVMDEPFRTFPEGFDEEIIAAFCEAIGVEGVLGNKAASGTEIIKELGEEHIRTGKPIVYTSADPVFQIAAHEEVVPVEKLYEWCEKAYEIAIPAGMSRVIARPFVGEYPDFVRTANRKDYTLAPPKKTVLDALQEAGVRTTAIGKIGNIYASQGLSDEIKTKDNDDGVAKTIECLGDRDGLIFTNLVDFDSKYGHRRDPQGYGDALMRFDDQLERILEAMDRGDLLIITADHGNDPTYRGTDHTREYVPLLVVEVGAEGQGRSLGTRKTFADVGASVADFFGVQWGEGESFL